MRPLHILLALLIVFIWGINFVFVKYCLVEISPLLLCALRFFLASVPAVFFVKLPKGTLKLVVAYGLVMFAMQFAFLFSGMHVGMTPGMASLLMQVQVIFTMVFAAIFLKERAGFAQILGAIISFTGIALVALHFNDDISLAGYLLILAAAASWGVGNLIAKKVRGVNMIAMVVWGSLIAFLPMLLISLLVEGPNSMIEAYHRISWMGIGSLFFVVYCSTWVGYGCWNWLVGNYPVGVVVPFTLLIPLVGLLSSAWITGEPLEMWKMMAALLVIAGVCVNIVSMYVLPIKAKQEEFA